MSRATRVGSALAGLVLAAGMLGAAPAAQAEPARVGVTVGDQGFTKPVEEVFQGDTVLWSLLASAQLSHSVTSAQEGLFHHVFGPAAQDRQFEWRFDTPGSYEYFCTFHEGMEGTIVVNEVPPTTEPTTTTTTAPPTTTTTAPPTTTTTARATTTTTRPASTTTTERVTTTTRPAGTTTTAPPTTTAPTTATTVSRGSVSGAAEPSTTTTPKKKKSTTTTKPKKKKSTTTTRAEAEETTTTIPAMPSLAAAAPPAGAPELPAPPGDIPDATGTGEEAASWVGREEGGSGGGHGKKLMFGLGGLGAVGLAGGGWRWYHRSSRYLPA